ncbi:hypothetical protein V6N13_074926 [Hibiscus sabdariffa]|uniref:Uncharacterized protein n=1 Tax=Hibiscus sabdariffa TaxID=183260 RepID=A0ABR2U9X8_9ROSI
MTGKNKADGKVLEKKHPSFGPKKLDLKKKKEEVKVMGMLIAETKAVQAELTQTMDHSLLSGQDPRTTAQQLRQTRLIQTRATDLGSQWRKCNNSAGYVVKIKED